MKKSALLVLIMALGFFSVSAKYLITGTLMQSDVPNEMGLYPSTCEWVNTDCSPKHMQPTFFKMFALKPEKGNWAEVDVEIRKDKLFLTIKKFNGIERIFFYFPKDLPLDPESTKELGQRSIVVRKGSYDVTYGVRNPLGSVAIDIIARK